MSQVSKRPHPPVLPRVLACLFVISVSAPAWAQESASRVQVAPPIALSFEQARTTLEQSSDALAAADAGVRGKLDLARATRSLRVPEVSVDVRQMEFQKTLSLPLGSLAPVAEAFGIPSPLQFRERDWRLRPVLSTVVPIYSGGAAKLHGCAGRW